jgi:hypothetical protein
MQVSAGQPGKGLIHRLQLDLNLNFINQYSCILPPNKVARFKVLNSLNLKSLKALFIRVFKEQCGKGVIHRLFLDLSIQLITMYYCTVS